MAEQKNFTKITLEQAVVAHMYSCPYYSPQMDEGLELDAPTKVIEHITRKGKKVKLVNDNNIPLCGANKGKCDGSCWYLSHYSNILQELSKMNPQKNLHIKK